MLESKIPQKEKFGQGIHVHSCTRTVILLLSCHVRVRCFYGFQYIICGEYNPRGGRERGTPLYRTHRYALISIEWGSCTLLVLKTGILSGIKIRRKDRDMHIRNGFQEFFVCTLIEEMMT